MPIATILPDAEVLPGTREAILDAAEVRFAERGFDGASVREIAADAGLRNQASLYHYFENKQAMYEAVLARGVSSITEMVAESERAGGLRTASAAARAENVTAYLDQVLDYLAAHPQLARLIQRAALDDDAFVRSVVPRLVQPLYAQGIRVLEDAPGAWRRDELPHLAAALYHMIFGYFASASLLEDLLGEDPRSRAALARQRRFIKTAVLQLLGVAPAAVTSSKPRATAVVSRR